MRILISLIAVLTIVAFTGCGEQTSGSSDSSADSAAQDSDAPAEITLDEQFVLVSLNATAASYVLAALGTGDTAQYASDLQRETDEGITFFRKHPDAELSELDGKTARQVLSDIAGDLEDTDATGQDVADDIDRALKNE